MPQDCTVLTARCSLDWSFPRGGLLHSLFPAIRCHISVQLIVSSMLQLSPRTGCIRADRSDRCISSSMHLTDTHQSVAYTNLPAAILKWDRLITTDVSCLQFFVPIPCFCCACEHTVVVPFSCLSQGPCAVGSPHATVNPELLGALSTWRAWKTRGPSVPNPRILLGLSKLSQMALLSNLYRSVPNSHVPRSWNRLTRDRLHYSLGIRSQTVH